MGRLTKREKDGAVKIAWDCPNECQYVSCSLVDGMTCQHQCEADIVGKLAKYEDLEEQCIAENQCGIGELLMKWKAFFDDIAELYEYRKAEEQGLLLRLPVPLGTTVYNTTWWDDEEEKIKVNGITFYRMVHKHKVSKSKFSLLDIKEFGKTVFLTKEEAESALAEKGGAE